MDPTKDIIFDVTCHTPEQETVTFVNVSYEKIQRAMSEAFRTTGVVESEDAEIFLNELANQLNKTGINTISWRGIKMKMNFSVE